jgi:hypothetical protein
VCLAQSGIDRLLGDQGEGVSGLEVGQVHERVRIC